MRWQATAIGRGRSTILVFGVLAILGWLGCQSPQALAGRGKGVTCAYNAATQIVTIHVGTNAAATIVRNRQHIHVNTADCESATVDNTLRIDVFGSAGGELVTVALKGGPFFNDVLGTRIPFRVTLGAGIDEFSVDGTDRADTIRAGRHGVDLNQPAARVDVTLSGVDLFSVTAQGGNDNVSCAGGEGAGGPSKLPCRLDGGTGDDRLTGGSNSDVFIGGPGFDVLQGRDGSDTADYRMDPGSVMVNLEKGVARDGTGARDRLAGIENVDGPDFRSRIIGNAKENHLEGVGTLIGRQGDDLLGGPLQVIHARSSICAPIWGGAHDLPQWLRTTCRDHDSSPISSAGSGSCVPGTVSTTGIDDERGGKGNDILCGTPLPDYEYGGRGRDTLEGQEDDDYLYGGRGVDSFDGGSGTNYCYQDPIPSPFRIC